MNSTDIVIILIVAVLLTAALLYLRKAKKAGKKCVGCPDGGTCSCKSHCCGHDSNNPNH